jgi:hypothetical protein
MGVLSSFSKHKLLKDKFTWKYQYILSLDYKPPKSEPNSPVAHTWRNVIDVTSNRARRLRWMCGLCNVIASLMRCRGAKLMVRNFCFWHPYIALFVDTYCVLYTKWNISVWSYEMSGETFFWSGVWFSYKKDLKMGCKNQNWKHRPVINVTYIFLIAKTIKATRSCQCITTKAMMTRCWIFTLPYSFSRPK